MKQLLALILCASFAPFSLAVSVKGPLSPGQQSDLSQWHNPFPENTFPITSPSEEASSSQTIWARAVFAPEVTEEEKEKLVKAIRRMNREAGFVILHPDSKDEKLVPIVIKTERSLTRQIPGYQLNSLTLAYGGADGVERSGRYPSGFVDLKKTLFGEDSDYLFPAFIHEIGHVLGMPHNDQDSSNIMWFESRPESKLSPNAIPRHLNALIERAKHQIRLRETPPQAKTEAEPHASAPAQTSPSTHTAPSRGWRRRK